LREQLADSVAQGKQDTDNLKRALDSMKLQNEENIRQINIKNEEIESMMEQLDSLGQIIEKKENYIADLNQNIMFIEMKNRKLNDLVNQAIYGQTQQNIDQTLEVLHRRGIDTGYTKGVVPMGESMVQDLGHAMTDDEKMD
jgi:hypothetical protein